MKRTLPWLVLLVLLAVGSAFLVVRDDKKPELPHPPAQDAVGALASDQPEHVEELLAKPEPLHTAPVADDPVAAPAEAEPEERPGIVGRVVHPAGFEDARYDVRLLWQSGVEWAQVRPWTTVAASQGWEFRFEGLEHGDYRVEAAIVIVRPVLAGAVDVQVSDGLARVELRVPTPSERDFIVVRISSPEGPVLSDLQISLRARNRQGGRSLGGPALHRGNGEYWLGRDDSLFREEGEGWWEVTIRAEGYAARTARYERDAVHVLDVILERPAYLVVEISGIEDHPESARFRVTYAHAGAMLEAWLATLPSQSRRQPPDAVNRYGPLEPGEYVVALQVDDGEKFVDRRTVQLLAGVNRVRLTAPELYSFSVMIPEELRDRGIFVRRVDNFGYWVAGGSIQEGISEVSGLFAGEHVIWRRDVGEMRVSLPAADGQTILFQPLPFNALWVSFRYATGEPETALKDGDIVVEIDGQSLADVGDAEQLARRSLHLDETTWVVFRENVRMTLNLDGKQLSNARVMFQPTRR